MCGIFNEIVIYIEAIDLPIYLISVSTILATYVVIAPTIVIAFNIIP
jgi:hypothetical protein